jgi:hypothetical protein
MESQVTAFVVPAIMVMCSYCLANSKQRQRLSFMGIYGNFYLWVFMGSQATGVVVLRIMAMCSDCSADLTKRSENPSDGEPGHTTCGLCDYSGVLGVCGPFQRSTGDFKKSLQSQATSLAL